MLAAVASVTVPIFAVIALGFAAVRSRYVDAGMVRALGGFVLRIAMPALIFGALAGAPLGDTLRPGYIAGYGAASLAVFGFGYLWARRARGAEGAAAAMQALGMACTNSGFMGYPIAALVIGPTATVVLANNLLVENFLIIPGALVLAELGRTTGRGPAAAAARVASGLARNPLVIAIAAGSLVAALGLPLPGWIDRPVALVGGVAAPLALFVIGGTVAGLPRGTLPAGTARVVAGKLVLHPLAVLGALLLAPGVDPLLLATGLLFAAMPMITIYPIIGAQFGEERACAAALLAATVASSATVPLVLVALETAGLVALQP